MMGCIFDLVVIGVLLSAVKDSFKSAMGGRVPN